MDSWWGELDDAVMRCVAERGTASLDEIASRLGLSERAANSLVALLVQEGRLRVGSVAAPSTPVEQPVPPAVPAALSPAATGTPAGSRGPGATASRL